MVVGFDTGFFVKLAGGDLRAAKVWDSAERGELEGAVSCVTLFELERLGLRGAVPREVASKLVAHIPAICHTIWLGEDRAFVLSRAARIAHGNGLAMADALILSSLLEAGASVIYTTDRDLAAYASGPPIVQL